MRYWLSDWWPIIPIVGVMGLLATLAIVADHSERKEWDLFSQAHKCKLVGETDGTSGFGTGVGSNGQVGFVSTYQSGKTGWLCDDGVTYWRSK